MEEIFWYSSSSSEKFVPKDPGEVEDEGWEVEGWGWSSKNEGGVFFGNSPHFWNFSPICVRRFLDFFFRK